MSCSINHGPQNILFLSSPGFAIAIEAEMPSKGHFYRYISQLAGHIAAWILVIMYHLLDVTF
jgi:hypothetical protein